MIVAGREVVWNEMFLENVAGIQQYISQYNPVRGRTFATEILDFTLEIIAPNPLIFIHFDHPAYTHILLRRAVFSRNYIILYEVFDDRIVFLLVYHASRDLGNLGL